MEGPFKFDASANLFHSGNKHRAEIRPGPVNGGGVTGRSGSQDQKTAMFGVTHVLLLQLTGLTLRQKRMVRNVCLGVKAAHMPG